MIIHATLINLMSLLVVSGYGNHTIWTRNLELVVDVACSCVELVVGGPAEDDVVGALEGHDLKRDHLFAKIIDVAEGHGKSDAAKGIRLFTRNHTMEFSGAVLKLLLGKVHPLQSLQVHDVQAGSTIHETLGEVIPVYAGTYNQGVVFFWHNGRMILPLVSGNNPRIVLINIIENLLDYI